VNKTEQVFGIPDSSGEPPEVRWAYKVRGFGDKTDAELADLFTFPIGAMTEYKEELLSTRTKWHRVDIYDVLRPQFQSYRLYQRSLRENNQTYESNNPELFAPDRILFVDGVLQTRRSAEIQYHEALVHPAMFAHSGPVNVLLLNVGSGAALREVLKHKSVERVTVVEEHPDLFEIIQEYFPEFNDCSFIVNASTGKCYDDSRVQVIFADLYDWVLEEYNDDGTGEGRNTSASIVEDPYDVVIMDDL
jgi:spermidine synthase